MTEEPDDRDLFDALCEVYLYFNQRQRNDLPPPAERAEQAIHLLRVYKGLYETARTEGRDEDAVNLLQTGRAIWSILTAGFGWLHDTPGLSPVPQRTSQARQLLLLQLSQFIDAIPSTHRRAIDPVPVMLPRWLHQSLLSALAALDAGEVREPLDPIKGRRHSAATWDAQRLMALRHVHYLHGRGLGLGKARDRVGRMMGVSPHTLREWKKTMSDEVSADLDVARAAGEMSVELEEDTTLGTHRDAPLGGRAYETVIEFREEPLAAFAARYRASPLGRRHNQ
jgi:hypothetical protein